MWNCENCFFKNILKNLFKKKELNKDILLGIGFEIKDVIKKNNLLDILLKNDNRPNHVQIFGSPGVGKTKLAENMIENDIKNGENLIYIDPKGDIELFSKIYQTAKLAGRENDIIFISSVHTDMSVGINPYMHYYIDEELIGHAMASISDAKGAEFFYNVAYDIATVIITALNLIRRTTKQANPINFDEIASYSHYEGLESLREKVKNLNVNSKEKDKVLGLFERILSSGEEYFGKTARTFATSLTKTTMGNIGKIVGSSFNNVFIEKLENDEGLILYVQTNSMLIREPASTISKLVLSLVQSSVGRYYASGEKYSRRLNIYIDEMASSMYKGVQTLYAQGRACNVSITGLTQSIADVIVELGPDIAKQLLDLTATKIVMRINESNAASILKEYGGDIKSYSPILSLNGGIATREVEEEAIREEDITGLKKREFYYFGYEGIFKGKTKPVEPPEINVKMPNILQRSK